MRKLVIAIVIILVLIGGGYGAYWYKKATDFKDMFAQSVATFNNDAKPYTKDRPLIRYSSVEITGFPFMMVLEINKPVVDVPVSAIIANSPRYKAKFADAAAPFNWVEELSYSEKITLTGNVMGDYFTLTTHGDRTNTSFVDNAPRHTLVTSSSAPMVCHLGVEHPKGTLPWTMEPLFTDLPTFLKVFRSYDCGAKNIVVKDKATGTEMFSTEAFSSSLTNAVIDATNNKIRITFNSQNAQATPAFDTIANDYMLMAYTLMGKPEAANPFPFSEAGKQNAKIDIGYEGPTDPRYLKDPSLHMHLDVNSFDIQSALFNGNATLHFADSVQGTDRVISLAAHTKMNVTARYDEIGQKNFIVVLGQLAKDDATKQLAQKLIAVGTPEAIAAKVYPQLHGLGDVALDIDFNAKGPNQPGGFLLHSAITLNDFNIVATPYGIKIKGTSTYAPETSPAPGATKASGNMSPNVDLSLTCISCNALVDDLGNYAMRLESVASQFSNTPNPPYVTAGMIDGVKQFLHGISESSSGNDLVIHVVMKDTGMLTISGKQLAEVMGVYMTTIAPHLPQAQPPAAQTAPPTTTPPAPTSAPKKKH